MKTMLKMLAGPAHDRMMAVVARPKSLGVNSDSEMTTIIARTFKLDDDLNIKLACYYNERIGDYYLDKLVDITKKSIDELVTMKKDFWSQNEYIIEGSILNDYDRLHKKLQTLTETYTAYGTNLIFKINSVDELSLILTEISNEILNCFYSVKFDIEINGIYEHFNFMQYPNTWTSNKEYTIFSIIEKVQTLDAATYEIGINVNMYNILHILDMMWFFTERLNSSIKFNINSIDLIPLDDNIVEYIKNQYSNFYNDYRKNWTDRNEVTNRTLDKIIESLEEKQNNDNMAIYEFRKTITQLGEQQQQYWQDYFPELKKILDFVERSSTTEKIKLQTVQKKRTK
jgi:hypothetical protein